MGYMSMIEKKCYWNVLGKISSSIKSPTHRLLWGNKKNNIDGEISRDLFAHISKNIWSVIILKTMDSNAVNETITRSIRNSH